VTRATTYARWRRPAPPPRRDPPGTCSTCGAALNAGHRDEPDWCYPCWRLADRVEGACVALSRVMTWVRLELAAEAWMRSWSDCTVVATLERQLMLGQAMQHGMLKLEWAR